jgi:hypothetical protein
MSDSLLLPEDEQYLLYARLAEEVKAELRGGRQPDVEALARRHPEWEGQIRQLVPVLAVVGQLGAAFAGQASGVHEPLTELGEFRIVREIGRGGMGIVYEAVQESLHRRVALKVLPLAAALDARQLQRFKTEAQAAAQLHHGNIVPIYAVGCERGIHYYAMQFIDGRTLTEFLRCKRCSATSWKKPALLRGICPPGGQRPGDARRSDEGSWARGQHPAAARPPARG